MSDDEMNLATLIDESDRGQTTEDLAGEVLHAVLTKHRRLAATLLFPVVRDEVRRRRRRDTADLESHARHGGDDALADRKAMLASCIWIPGDGMVAHGKCSPTQLRTRAEYLRKMAAALVFEVDQLEAEAESIELAGATCLNDLEPALA